MPAAAFVARGVDQGIGEGHAYVRPEPFFGDAQNSPIGQMGQEGGNGIQDTSSTMQALVSSTDPLCGSYRLCLRSHSSHLIFWNNPVDYAASVNLQLQQDLVDAHILQLG